MKVNTNKSISKYQPLQRPRIEFERTCIDCYNVHFDRAVLVGTLARRGRNWIFFPEEDLGGLSRTTMQTICEKIEWLEGRIVEDNIY